MSKKTLRAVLCLALCLVINSMLVLPAAAENDAQTIRVGWYDTDENLVSAHGYDYEYLQALSQYTGWSYEYVTGTWEQCLSWLENGEIDLLGFVHKTPEREAKFGYPSLPMATTGGLLVTEENSDIHFSVEALSGLSVGIVRGNAFNDSFEKYRAVQGFEVNYVYYNSLSDIAPALAAGEVDMAVVAEEDKTSNERILAKFASNNQYFVTDIDNSRLLAQLDAAMVEVNTYCPYLNGDLYQKYFSLNTDGKPTFTAAEQEFINTHPNILVQYDSGWPPIEYMDAKTGEYKGISPDLFSLLSEKCGISFIYEGSTSGAVLEGLADEDNKNVLTTISYDYGWAEQHNVLITQPFISSGIVKLGKNLNAENPVVAINEKAFFTYLLADELKDATTQNYAKQSERLEAVRTGAADYTFVTEDQANYYRSIPKYSKLQTERVVGYEQQVCISITKNSDPELMSIISKSLASISHDEMTAIVLKNTVDSYELTFGDMLQKYSLFLVIALLILAGIIVVVSAKLRIDKSKRLASDQANQAKSSFLSHVSHDIRTPLNAIIGITALAIDEDDPKIEKDYLNKINESGKYLLGLINDTLDMSKIESGKLSLHPEPVCFKEVFDVIMAVITPKATEKKLNLTLEHEGADDSYIMLDKLRYEQIILNLLNNAVKFTPEGGNVSCRVEILEQSERTCRQRITIADNGVGMSEEFQKKLFMPFEQERNRLSVENAGTGLGLSIVKSLVDLMDGTVTCKSRQGEGTSFTVELSTPLATAEEIAGKDEAAIPSDDAILQGRRVLLAEDNSMNTLVAEKMLTAKGIEVVCVKNGRLALEEFTTAKKGYFDAVLMDIHMPEMDGLAASKAIRESNHPDAGTIKIIALSANAYDEDKKECLAAGMNDHVAKPIEPELLFNALKQAFQNR